jgi:hypothetical protein
MSDVSGELEPQMIAGMQNFPEQAITISEE